MSLPPTAEAVMWASARNMSDSTVGEQSVTVRHPITEALVHVFRGIVDASSSMSGNKQASLEHVPSYLGGQVSWGDHYVTVGGQLWSTFVRLHPLPNANHRSSLGLVLLYLQANDITVDVSDLDENVVNEAIRESKRLLTVRRRATAFYLLEDAGCQGVIRKRGVRIAFRDYELQLDSPYDHYDAHHEHHAVSFISELVPQEQQTVEGNGFQSFRDTLG